MKLYTASQITLLMHLSLHLVYYIIDKIYTAPPTLSHRSSAYT